MKKTVFILLAILALSACSSAPQVRNHNPSITMAANRVDFNDTPIIKKILRQQYQDWRRVGHRMGGMSKKGIDCSGLVYRTYREKFGVAMPRSTEYQAEAGQAIHKNQLKAGDMVFFKTGLASRHVGMYIEKGNFLHVSSSRGVMISNLSNPYWSNTYWQARRIQ